MKTPKEILMDELSLNMSVALKNIALSKNTPPEDYEGIKSIIFETASIYYDSGFREGRFSIREEFREKFALKELYTVMLTHK